MRSIVSIYKIDDIFAPKDGRVEYMRSNPLSKWHTTLDQDDIDSNEMFAREMMAEGLTGDPKVDTWNLNARIDHHHIENHHRARRSRRNYVGLS